MVGLSHGGGGVIAMQHFDHENKLLQVESDTLVSQHSQ